MSDLYKYRAKVTRIYDGDTWTLDIDLGFFTWMRDQNVRLFGINTPELRGVERPEGIMVRDHCLALWPVGTELIVETIKDSKGKYGRWLAILHDLDGTNINDYLIEKGMAREYLVG